MVYKFFDKKSSDGAAMLANKSAFKNENMSNNKLPEELDNQLLENYAHLL